MTISVHDIIELLDIVKLYSVGKPTPRDYVQKSFHDKPVRHARLLNYQLAERICRKLDLITVKNNNVSLTKLGEKMLEFHEEKKPEFQEFVIKNVFFGSKVSEEIQDAFSKFSARSGNALGYPKQEIQSLFEDQVVLPILYEMDLLEKKDGWVEINQKYIQLVKQHETKITQKQLEMQLENQKIIGAIAEEIVLDFEQKRLVCEGHAEKSKEIEQISASFANAGYDIESFSIDKNGDAQRIYIEVKGSSGDEFDFYLSANELRKAEEYGNQYWIYFVPGIDVKMRQTAKEITVINNPFKSIFNNPEYLVEAEKYHIAKKESARR